MLAQPKHQCGRLPSNPAVMVTDHQAEDDPLNLESFSGVENVSLSNE
jgi:hypothetical protein